MPDRKANLDFATNEELVDELGRRSSGLIVAMCPLHESDYSWVIFTRGSFLIQQGLGQLILTQLKRDARQKVAP